MGIEREIEVVENMIRILNDCLVIYMQNQKKRESIVVLNDIKMCKAELKKLLAAREAAQKEPAKDAAI
jgi:hypothetical protein